MKRYTDTDGSIMPWFTKPMLDEMRRWDMREWRVFEWGSGYSTPWLARRCKKLVSCDHDPAWTVKVKALCQNAGVYAHLNQLPDVEYYCRNALLEGGNFNLIIIDGFAAWRNACMDNTLTALAAGGRVIVDNCERQANYDHAKQVFAGMKLTAYPEPGDEHGWTTACWEMP